MKFLLALVGLLSATASFASDYKLTLQSIAPDSRIDSETMIIKEGETKTGIYQSAGNVLTAPSVLKYSVYAKNQSGIDEAFTTFNIGGATLKYALIKSDYEQFQLNGIFVTIERIR